jgi:hypothetical protein
MAYEPAKRTRAIVASLLLAGLIFLASVPIFIFLVARN